MRAMPNGYFDIKRDVAIEKEGGFFCKACLTGLAINRQSPDPRYCNDCYDSLVSEAEMLPPKKRPAWVPRHQAEESVGTQFIRGTLGAINMSTPLNTKIKGGLTGGKPMIIRTPGRRGPKYRTLPEKVIRSMRSDGLSSKTIAARLEVDFGIHVSYKTIQRLLDGKRKSQPCGIV